MWIPLSVRCPPTPSTERPTGTPNSWDTTPWWRCGQRPQEILHSRLRGGSSQKGAAHFVVEAVNRVRRAGAAGPLTVRADSGFWSYRLIADLDRLRVEGPDQNGGFKLNGGFREDATIVRGGTPQFETLVNPPLCRGIASPFCTHHDLGIEPITSQQ